jgi:hypothetical protein
MHSEESFPMPHLLARFAKAALLAGCTALLAAPARGQAPPAGSSPADGSRLDLYGGYGWWDPSGAAVGGYQYPQLYNPNATVSLSYYFLRNLGFQAEGGYFSKGPTLNAAGACNEIPCSPLGQRFYTAEGGPIVRFPLGNFIPFAHVLGGGEKLSGPRYNRLTWGWGITAGAGIDYVLPFFHDLIAVRPIQADFEYQQVSYGALQLPASNVGGFASFPSFKLSGGLVLRFGEDAASKAHNEPMLGCEASPSAIHAGDPVTVTASPMNFKAGKPKTYQWATTGGEVTPGEDSATVATVELPPGGYTVNGILKQGKAIAKCVATFTVEDVEPPTLSCSADPATVQAGGVSIITAKGTSSGNRDLSYSFTSDGGQLTQNGNKAQLATAGVPAQAINVVCNVVDDQGKTAQSGTMVTLLQTAGPAAVQSAALPPPLAQSQSLCGVSFERDTKRPVRVDNEAKACLDDIALTLQRETDAKLVAVGNFGAGESATEAAERALNVRQYLADEKGIDPNRIEVRYGGNSGRTEENIMLPAGVTYDNDRTTAFDPTSVKRIGQAYGKPGQHRAGGARRHPTQPKRRHRKAAAPGHRVAAPAPR